MEFPYKSAVLIGMGKSNAAVARYLSGLGVSLTLCDRNENVEIPDDIRGAADKINLGRDYLSIDGAKCIFLSPGIRPDLPEILQARENGACLMSEAELFFSLTPARTVAVTGSDGKTTTATMAYEILRQCHGAVLCGNIGTPMLDILPSLTENDFCVVELSSFQLMNLRPKTVSAAITNITENHLNWHTGMEEYIAAKLNIFEDCKRRIANADDRVTDKAEAEVYFSAELDIDALRRRHPRREYVLAEGKNAVLYANGDRRILFSTDALAVLGVHNLKNAMTAAALCAPFCTDSEISRALSGFRGVSHRAQKIGEKNGVTFIESSIDSTPSRTAQTLASLGKKCIVICGGADKCLSYAPLCDALAKFARAVIFTGACGNDMLCALAAHPQARNVPYAYIGDFHDATAAAISLARAGDTVVLSPAATSFDRFKSYIHRAECFAEIVNEYVNKY